MPKERKKVLCMDAQRHAEYYGMQQTFDEMCIRDRQRIIPSAGISNWTTTI